MPSVLIVDDLSAIHEMLAAVIQPTGYEMSFAMDGGEALEKYKVGSFDVILADISMQPMDGITLLQELKTYDPECVVIMMTGYASTETAVKALKFGAFDYIQKPFKIDELIKTLKRAVEFRSRSRGPRAEGESSIDVDLDGHIVGHSRKIQRIRQQASKLMAAHAPLLIHGERGTGKRTIAQLIHDGSSSSDKPFIVVDCALRDEGFLSGLIGEDGRGGDWVVKAKGGTLFLQQVERLSPELQRALVSVLKGTINETRIICATAIDLEPLVDEGEFDDELFYRIAALPMHIPPLREHLEDIPLLVKSFINQAKNPSFEPSQIEFAADALEVMSRYSWPGNVVELGQVVTSLATAAEDRIVTAAQLPAKLKSLDEWQNLASFLAEHEAAYIRRVLHACGGDKKKAASVLECAMERIEQTAAAIEA